jgi:hypothetical protein
MKGLCMVNRVLSLAFAQCLAAAAHCLVPTAAGVHALHRQTTQGNFLRQIKLLQQQGQEEQQ